MTQHAAFIPQLITNLTGKKQLNRLITLLDKEGGIRGSNRNVDLALPSVRAKREADEAGVLAIDASVMFTEL